MSQQAPAEPQQLPPQLPQPLQGPERHSQPILQSQPVLQSQPILQPQSAQQAQPYSPFQADAQPLPEAKSELLSSLHGTPSNKNKTEHCTVTPASLLACLLVFISPFHWHDPLDSFNVVAVAYW